MAVPADPTYMQSSATDANESIAVSWVAGDATETQFDVEFSIDAGGSWGPAGSTPAGSFTLAHTAADDGDDYRYRVRATNGDGSSSWLQQSVDTAWPTPISEAETLYNTFYLFVGELMGSTGRPGINEPNYSPLYGGEGDVLAWWSARQGINNIAREAAFAAYQRRTWCWDHIGLVRGIATVTPNSPLAGQTKVVMTTPAQATYLASDEVLVDVKNSGIAGFNGEHVATFIDADSFWVDGVAAASGVIGTIEIPGGTLYDGDANSNTDENFGGTLPNLVNTFWGLDHSFMARADDAANVPTPTGNSFMLKLPAARALRSVPADGSADEWWLKQLSGETDSTWDHYERLLQDVKTWIDRSPFATSTNRIGGIILGTGYNEASIADLFSVISSSDIASIVIGGATVTVTTVANLPYSEPTGSGTAKLVAKIAGTVGGTLAVEGTVQQITVTGAKTFTLDHIDATLLTAPTSVVNATAELSDPIYRFEADLTQHITDLRSEAVTQLATGQTASTIPVALLRMYPNPRLIPYGEVAPLLLRADQEAVAGTMSGVGLLNADDMAFKDGTPSGGNPITVPEDPSQFAGTSLLTLGNRAWDVIQKPGLFNIGAGRRPAIIVGLCGHSYVVGTSATAFTLDDDPMLISEAPPNHMSPVKVWNHSEAGFENLLIVPGPLDSNCNSSPVWNKNVEATAGPLPSLLRGLTERFPDETIYCVPLGVNGSTLAYHDITQAGTTHIITAVTVNATTVTVTVADPVKIGKDFTVNISGVSGLSTTINGAGQTGTPLAPIGYTYDFTLPITTTGTPVITGATAQWSTGVWDPTQNEIWTEWSGAVENAYEWLWDANLVPDARACFVSLGVNDAVLGVSDTNYAAAMSAFVTANRLLWETRGQPREEFAHVWLKTIQHDAIPASYQTAVTAVRAAQVAAAAADSRLALLDLDEDADFLADYGPISDDDVHPTYRGYVQMGYRMTREGLDAISGWSAPLVIGGGGSGLEVL